MKTTFEVDLRLSNSPWHRHPAEMLRARAFRAVARRAAPPELLDLAMQQPGAAMDLLTIGESTMASDRLLHRALEQAGCEVTVVDSTTERATIRVSGGVLLDGWVEETVVLDELVRAGVVEKLRLATAPALIDVVDVHDPFGTIGPPCHPIGRGRLLKRRSSPEKAVYRFLGPRWGLPKRVPAGMDVSGHFVHTQAGTMRLRNVCLVHTAGYSSIVPK